MTAMRDAYKKIGADYDDVLQRLMSDDMVARFAVKFLDDDSMPNLDAAMAAGDAKAAFIAAHTLKGVCQNLSFDNLYRPAVDVTEALRNATDITAAEPLMPALREAYAKTVAAIREAM